MEKMLTQDQWNNDDGQNIKEIKSKISKERCITQENCLKEILPNLSDQMKRKLTVAQDTGLQIGYQLYQYGQKASRPINRNLQML